MAVDVPLAVRFDALKLYGGGAANLFDLALAGVPGHREEVRLDLIPMVDTTIGPIRYPGPLRSATRPDRESQTADIFMTKICYSFRRSEKRATRSR